MKIIKYREAHIFVFSTLLITISILLFGSTADAMVIRGGEEYNLESYQTVEDDLYVGAETITLSGSTTGDVFVAGSKVKIDGIIAEDVFVVGGEVKMYGDIQGDLRAGGGDIYIDGHIGEDLVLAGGKVTITQQSVIEGDLLVFAEYFEYLGTTTGVAKIYAGTVVIKGGIGNNVEIKASESISIQERASIQGDLTYESPREAFIVDESVVKGTIQHNEVSRPGEVKGVNWYSLFLEILIAVIAASALAYFFPRHTRIMVDIVFKESFWNSFKGLALLFAIPIIAIVAMFTMIGILPALLVLFVYASSFVTALALSPILAGVILARWAKKEDEELKFAWISAGAFAMAIVTFLPIIGWLVRFLIFLFAFYAVLSLLYKGVWSNRKVVAVEAPVKTEENNEEKIEDDSKQDETNE